MSDPHRLPQYDLYYVLALPLRGGRGASLRMPREMSSEDYALLRELLDINLTQMRRALVNDPPVAATPTGEQNG